MQRVPRWYYNELQQAALDVDSMSHAEVFDRDQGGDPESAQQIIQRLGISREHRLIDLGCGTGSFALNAAETCGAIDAVDVSRAMLSYASTQADIRGIQNIVFHHGGFLSYEHGADPADFVITRYALHHLPDFWKMAGLYRLAGMLKPGGHLYLEDIVFSFDPAGGRAGIKAWISQMAKPKGQGLTREDLEAHIRDEFSTYGWILEGMLARAGLEIEDVAYGGGATAQYFCVKKAT